jgi:predicted ribosome quality control (RQC) complex YloA/Tae2 family protein
MTSEQRTPARVTAFRQRLERLKKMEDETHYRARGEGLMERLKAVPEHLRRIATSDEIDETIRSMRARSGVLRPKLKASIETIRDEIRKANADSQTRGEKYGPNILCLAKTVKHALNERKLDASHAYIRKIANEPEFRKLRGPVGKRAKYR